MREHFCGIYRAVVVDVNDPTRRKRVLVQIPLIFGTASIWAAACLPPGYADMPTPGSGLWVMFEGADPDRPVWVGSVVPPT